jgi:hypothetical protein
MLQSHSADMNDAAVVQGNVSPEQQVRNAVAPLVALLERPDDPVNRAIVRGLTLQLIELYGTGPRPRLQGGRK